MQIKRYAIYETRKEMKKQVIGRGQEVEDKKSNLHACRRE